MANRYGEAALIASRRGPSAGNHPVARWEEAMKQLYPTSRTAQQKGCPRGAFLGLCEEGFVKGVPAGKYTASTKDKAYAVRAVELLLQGTRSWSVTSLWRAVTDDAEVAHDHQMDIVMALWKNDLIVRKESAKEEPVHA